MTDLEYMFGSKTMPGPSSVKWVESKQYLPHKAVVGSKYDKPCQLLNICPGNVHLVEVFVLMSLLLELL